VHMVGGTPGPTGPTQPLTQQGLMLLAAALVLAGIT
jgi:hypothetical protein